MNLDSRLSYIFNNHENVEILQAKKTKTSNILNSFVSMRIRFDLDAKLRFQFNFLNEKKIRVGKILQILDSISAMTTFEHTGEDKATFVTAGVDSMKLFNKIDINRPLVINSYVTYTGFSSIEIRIDLYNDMINSFASFLGSAFFTFVARDKSDYSKAYRVPPLNLSCEEFSSKAGLEEVNKAMLRNQIAEESTKYRKKLKSQSLLVMRNVPDLEAIRELHNLLYTKENIQTEGRRVLAIEDTLTEKVQIMHTQDINMNGHIFGGYIMRESIELAFACAKLFLVKSGVFVNPFTLNIGSISFHKPVIVSSIATFQSKVIYTEDDLIHVVVEVFNIVDKLTEHTTSIHVTFSYESESNSSACETILLPKTYEEALLYIEGKRRVKNILK